CAPARGAEAGGGARDRRGGARRRRDARHRARRGPRRRTGRRGRAPEGRDRARERPEDRPLAAAGARARTGRPDRRGAARRAAIGMSQLLTGDAPVNQSVERAVRLLSFFSPEEPELTLTQLTQRLGTSKATTHRYTLALR